MIHIIITIDIEAMPTKKWTSFGGHYLKIIITINEKKMNEILDITKFRHYNIADNTVWITTTMIKLQINLLLFYKEIYIIS